MSSNSHHTLNRKTFSAIRNQLFLSHRVDVSEKLKQRTPFIIRHIFYLFNTRVKDAMIIAANVWHQSLVIVVKYIYPFFLRGLITKKNLKIILRCDNNLR